MSIELAARVRLRPACTPVCHMVPVTYVRTHISPPVLCNAFESYLHLNPCLLVILPYCHFSHIFPKEQTQKSLSVPPAWCDCIYIHITSHRISRIALHATRSVISSRWIAHKTRMLQMLQLVTSITILN